MGASAGGAGANGGVSGQNMRIAPKLGKDKEGFLPRVDSKQRI